MEIASLLNFTSLLTVLDSIYKNETEFYVRPEGRNVTLILGGSGVGKSTLVQRLIGLDSELIAAYHKKKHKFYIDQPNKTKIGHETTVSRTIVPEISKNNQTGAFFGDMPGFDDTRGASYTLTTTYFMKKILKEIENVKLVFLISWSTLNGDGDKSGFQVFLQTVSKYVKDISKFENSVALVVTKIPETASETIVGDVLDILKEISTTMNPNIDKTFLNILLKDINGTYPRINVAKTPNIPGSKLSDIPYMVDNVANLTSMINKLEFTKIHTSDFDYPALPKDSLNDIGNLIEIIKNNIYSYMESYMSNFTNFLTNNENRIHDIFKLKNYSVSLYDKLMKINEELGRETEATKCVSGLSRGLGFIAHRPLPLLTNVTLYSNYFDILQNFNPNPDKRFDCSKNLDSVIKNASESRDWYLFLNQLYTTLSGYEIQKDIPSSKCFALYKIRYDLKINTTDFFEKLKKCHTSWDDNNYISKINLDSNRIIALEKLLKFTMNSNLQVSCDAHSLRVLGRYVRFTDVKKAILENCSSSARPKNVEIFALDGIFANDNLNLTDHLNMVDETVRLSIISPNWYIDGGRQVTLDGKSASAIDPHKNNKSSAPGKPGLPGGPGGNFLGVGTKFTNLNNLLVSLNGGDGGEGQVGGDGINGTPGHKAELSDVKVLKLNDSHKNLSENYIYLGRVEHNIFSDDRFLWYYFTSEQHFNINNKTWGGSYLDVNIDGHEGTKGENGGSGGIGGFGGNAGIYVIAALNETFVINSNKGREGLAADGGKGGEGGRTGSSLNFIWDNLSFLSEMQIDDAKITYKTVESNGALAASGEKGTKGGNNQSRVDPIAPILQSNLSEVINDYKKYLRENLRDSVIESKLVDFFSFLESDNNISELFDIAGLTDDFEKLESQYFSLHDSIPFLPFYESLLSRIGKDTSNETLNYLRAALLTKIYNIKHNTDNYIVVNVKDYVYGVLNDIADYQNIIQRVKIIDDHENYQKTICEQIIEANKIINDQIFSEIDNIYTEMDGEISELIRDLQKQRNELAKNENELYEKKSKLLSFIPMKISAYVLKSVASVVALTGPYGIAASIPLTVGSNILEGIGEEQKSKISSFAEKASAYLKDTYKFDEALNKNKYDSSKLNVSRKLYQKYEKEMKIYAEIKDIAVDPATKATYEKGYDKYKEKSDPHDVDVQSNKKIQQLENDKLAKERSDIRTEKVILGVKEVSASVTQILDVVSQTDTQLSQLDQTIDATAKQFSQLITAERYYKEILIPDVNNFNFDMFRNWTNLANTSFINLDLIKWKMENALKDFKFRMEYTIQAPPESIIKRKFLNCIDKLLGGMTTVVKIYERILNYKEQQKLAGFIRNIPNTGINISDKKMMGLKSTLQANLILLEYEKVFSTFKLYIFPHIHQYTNLSSDLVWSKNLPGIVSRVTENLKTMKKKLDLDFNSLHNEKIFSNNKYTGTESFYVWDYNMYKTEISKLLLGEEVTLEADIMQSHQVDAMKFKEIGIAFLFANESLESEFRNKSAKIKVVMTHMGNSGYKCGNKYYVLNHNIINFTHSLDAHVVQNSYQGYYGFDNNYDKLKNNTAIFSPYATWRLKLFDSSTSPRTDKNSFFQSGKFHNQTVNLALEGIGGYAESASCEGLEKYYTLM